MPTIVAAYRDWARVSLAVRTIVLDAFLIVLAISVAAELIPRRVWEQQLFGPALGLAQDAL